MPKDRSANPKGRRVPTRLKFLESGVSNWGQKWNTEKKPKRAPTGGHYNTFSVNATPSTPEPVASSSARAASDSPPSSSSSTHQQLYQPQTELYQTTPDYYNDPRNAPGHEQTALRIAPLPTPRQTPGRLAHAPPRLHNEPGPSTLAGRYSPPLTTLATTGSPASLLLTSPSSARSPLDELWPSSSLLSLDEPDYRGSPVSPSTPARPDAPWLYPTPAHHRAHAHASASPLSTHPASPALTFAPDDPAVTFRSSPAPFPSPGAGAGAGDSPAAHPHLQASWGALPTPPSVSSPPHPPLPPFQEQPWYQLNLAPSAPVAGPASAPPGPAPTYPALRHQQQFAVSNTRALRPRPAASMPAPTAHHAHAYHPYMGGYPPAQGAGQGMGMGMDMGAAAPAQGQGQGGQGVSAHDIPWTLYAPAPGPAPAQEDAPRRRRSRG